MSEQRVLILSASVGTGHTSAAAALEDAFNAHPGVTVRTQDVLELTNEAYTTLSADTYQLLAKRMPWLLGLVYDLNDEPLVNEQPLRKLWDLLNTQPVVRFVTDYRPHICICTHFTPAGIIAQLMARGQLTTSLSVVTTDYDFQGMWLSTIFNRYFVAREESQARLIDLGVSRDRITLSGIPVRSVFGEPVDREAVFRKYELRADVPVIVVSAGAVGGGPAGTIVGELIKLDRPVQCIIVCGKNTRLLHEIDALALRRAEMFRVLGFTADMPDLVRIATLFVGKPGGLTSAECMAAGTPMVIVEPIPGQEERNADYLLEAGAAVRCNDLSTIDYTIERVLSDPARLDQLRAHARRIGRPDAARVIAETALADRRAPVTIDGTAASPARALGRTGDGARLPWQETPRAVAIYDADRGIYLGMITPAQLRKLRRALPDLDGREGTATLEPGHLPAFQEIGADAELRQRIERRLARDGTLRIRHSSVRLDPPASQPAEA